MDNPVGIGSSYIRVSRKVQDTERQELVIAEWALRRGLTIAHSYIDKGGSRDQSEKRANFQKVMAHVREAHIQWVVIENIERFGVKDNDELSSFIFDLRKNGCQLWSVIDDKCISSNDDATVIANVLAAMTSRREQYWKGSRALTAKLRQAQEGTWVGGHVPYGCDVVCVRGGEVIWRMVIESRDRRIQIDGDKVTRFDGPSVVPPHNKTVDKLFLAPSIHEERLKNIRNIFTWFSEESITTGRIAARLNERGEPAVYSRLWYAGLVDGILRNPVYVGRPMYNKKAHGRFHEYRDGKIDKAPRRNTYYPITGRKRDKKDWVGPDKPLFDPIVPPEVFERVQAKLIKGKKKTRAPKNERLWLAGLVYCGKCGEKMNAAAYDQEKGDQRSYLCRTFAKYKAANASGCKSHRVRHVVLEDYVQRYLTDSGNELKSLKPDKSDLLDNVKVKEADLRVKAYALVDRALDFIKDSRGERGKVGKIARREYEVITGHLTENLKPHEWTAARRYNIQFYFGYVFQTYNDLMVLRRPSLEAKARKKNEELARLVTKFADLEGTKARQIANEMMAKVEGELATLEAMLEPLEDHKRALIAETDAAMEKFREAEEAMEGEDYRRKAEAIRQVVSRINCHFEYRTHGTQVRSVLVGVDIEASDGALTSFSNTTAPGPG